MFTISTRCISGLLYGNLQGYTQCSSLVGPLRRLHSTLESNIGSVISQCSIFDGFLLPARRHPLHFEPPLLNDDRISRGKRPSR